MFELLSERLLTRWQDFIHFNKVRGSKNFQCVTFEVVLHLLLICTQIIFRGPARLELYTKIASWNIGIRTIQFNLRRIFKRQYTLYFDTIKVGFHKGFGFLIACSSYVLQNYLYVTSLWAIYCGEFLLFVQELDLTEALFKWHGPIVFIKHPNYELLMHLAEVERFLHLASTFADSEARYSWVLVTYHGNQAHTKVR